MVFCFLVHTVSPEENFSANVCYWEPFAILSDKGKSVEETSSSEREALHFVMSRVQSEYSFQVNVSDSPSKNQSISEHGVFKQRKQSTFLPIDSNIVWKVDYCCAFVLMLSMEENIPLAEYILNLIISYATNIFNMIENSFKQLVVYPDKMAAVTHVFLPCGRLIFMNHRLVKQYEKELDKILSSKK